MKIVITVIDSALALLHVAHVDRAEALRRWEVLWGIIRGECARTVYECPRCERWYLGVWRCDECGQVCRRIGAGGFCPHCEEIVTVRQVCDFRSDS